MQFKRLLTEDDAVSPVIGVILMVAITVILAAVIASFVLGLGDSQDVAPNTNFQWDYDQSAEELEISVSGGDSVNSDRLTIVGDLGPDNTVQNSLDDAGNVEPEDNTWTELADLTDSERLSAGSSLTLADEQNLNEPVTTEYDIRVVWTSQDGDSSSTLSSNSGPDA